MGMIASHGKSRKIARSTRCPYAIKSCRPEAADETNAIIA